ncbi:hypothetical protein [Pasteuria penetrans]|nr:hypothetical protein [Pasteuria penetrans]
MNHSFPFHGLHDKKHWLWLGFSPSTIGLGYAMAVWVLSLG